MMKDTITFRYRMSDRDVFYGGGVVNGARSITLMEDAAKRLMAKTFGNTGRCVEVKKVRLYTPCFAGDYMEYIAGIRKQEGNKVLIEVRSFKIIALAAIGCFALASALMFWKIHHYQQLYSSGMNIRFYKAHS
jgi:3-aminobutyryl-CoA ammonia-lyase